MSPITIESHPKPHLDLSGDHREGHNTTWPPTPSQPFRNATMIVVSGPAGSGKSTVASYLARELSIPYLEGDDYHSSSNRAKMSSGLPLTDADRKAWLIALRESALRKLQQQSNIVVVSCSALKRIYRDELRAVSSENPAVQVCFIHLETDLESLQARVKARVGHYMKDNMVLSQLEILEEPMQDEVDVTKINSQRSSHAVCRDALTGVQVKLMKIRC